MNEWLPPTIFDWCLLVVPWTTIAGLLTWTFRHRERS